MIMRSDLIYRGGKGYTLHQAVRILKSEKIYKTKLT